ncbi:site-2 protease family protein [Archaeoglobus veneficus]|uniref:Peptidase M50 n=1 Tax=Archaeoglobus veneficus (strain DSM 11195 / SNP6) TaxID=693661 RepID=F2KQG6_ARCVS|nr:site-2 protease family protein [Archaeoglobus veneficus]AEA47699.1 peptidase M50 [Archaeoglobus veneficus SNP6]
MLSPAGIAIVVIIVYWSIVEYLKSKGILEKYGISSIGPVLMVRTKRGLDTLEKLSRPKKFWRIVADAGIPAVFAGMIFMFLLIIAMDVVLFTSPPPPSPVTEPRNMLLIPWVNTLFPPEYLLLGLIVTLIVHELGHAILCRVEGVRVKALGVLLAIVPIGGFAEPDEKELVENTTRIQRIRIYSAGVISNFIVAIIAFSAFFYLLNFVSPLVVVVGADNTTELKTGDIIYEINGVKVRTPEDVTDALLKGDDVIIKADGKVVTLPKIAGVKIVDLYPEYPAAKAGLKKGMIIYRINDTETPTLYAFKKFMDSTKPGQTLSVFVYNNGSKEVYNVTLAKSPYGDSGFLGVVIEEYISGVSLGYSEVVLSQLKSLPSKLTTVHGWLTVVAMPLGFKGFGGEASKYFEPVILGDGLFYILNTLYWIGWINFYVGLFNCLPAIPLDGGRIFHESFTALLSRRFGERGEQMSMKTVRYLAYIVFASILLSAIIPNISGFLK